MEVQVSHGAEGTSWTQLGKYEGEIRDYIRNQLEDDIANDQLSLKEFTDPFNGWFRFA